MKDILTQSYGYIFEEALIDEIVKVATFKEFKADDYLIEIGDYIKTMPLLLNGAIKILREDENGDELLLYFLERGDTCAMTLTCCMGQSKSRIRAIAETNGSLLMIPVEKMEDWLTKYKTWRNFADDQTHARGPRGIKRTAVVLSTENVLLPLFATALCVTTARPAAAPPAGGGAEFPPLELAPPTAAFTSAPALTLAVTSDAEVRRRGMVGFVHMQERKRKCTRKNKNA
jgi:hypothetical protein